MIKSKTAAILAFFLSAASLSGCAGGDGNANATPQGSNSNRSDKSNSLRTNAEELGMLIKIPYQTDDIVWKEDPAKKRILAVMRFSPADATKVVAEAGAVGTPETSVTVESWFPDELIAQSEMSGDATLKGFSYPATAFVQEPYTIGKITRIDKTDYFILELLAK